MASCQQVFDKFRAVVAVLLMIGDVESRKVQPQIIVVVQPFLGEHGVDPGVDGLVLFVGDGDVQHDDPGLGEPLEGAPAGRFQYETSPEGIVGMQPPEGIHGFQVGGQADGCVVVFSLGHQLQNPGKQRPGLADDDIHMLRHRCHLPANL